ncbi:MAG TPA: N-acetylmuramoyl-L-alanine amidase [Terriglobales bacterium]
MQLSRLSAVPIAATAFAIALLGGAAHLLRYPTIQAQTPAASQLSVYSPQVFYTVPLLNLNGQPYVGLVELLEPLGTVDARPDGKKYKLKFTSPGAHELEFQFQEGKDNGKVKGDKVKLPSLFAIQSGRGYVPLASASELLSRALSTQIRLNPTARRLFIGNIGDRFTLDLRKGTPSKLFVSFDSTVNPTIATEPGHIRFTFRREPVMSVVDHETFTDPLITGASFSEHDGIAELDISGTSALMANFADGGKTIIVTGAPPPPPSVSELPIAQPSVVLSTAPIVKAPAGPRFLVLIDPAHGGSEIGSAISPTLPEKDVVLALARKVQHELANRGIAAGLLRNSDITITLDQRAISANAARPAIYVAIHAANSGKGVHVFTSLLPAAVVSTRDFLPWESAQTPYLDLSASVAGSVSAELETRKLPNTVLAAPLRPMNNIAAPAIAIEIASPSGDVNEIASATYLDQVAQSIAAGIAAVRGKIFEVRP